MTFCILIGFFIAVLPVYLFFIQKGKKYAVINLRAWPAAVTESGCRSGEWIHQLESVGHFRMPGCSDRQYNSRFAVIHAVWLTLIHPRKRIWTNYLNLLENARLCNHESAIMHFIVIVADSWAGIIFSLENCDQLVFMYVSNAECTVMV